MSDFKVTLTKDSFVGWHWHIEDGNYEMSNFAFTKWGAKKAVSKAVRHWESKAIIETYTIKAKAT